MIFKFDQIFGVFESSIDASIARQKKIAHNVSNINTPGFKRFLIDSEEQLKNAEKKHPQLPLKVTQEKHIGLPAGENSGMKRDLSPGLRADGNNVDLEKEMALMVQNDIYFNAVLNQLNKKIAVLKYVTSDGRG